MLRRRKGAGVLTTSCSTVLISLSFSVFFQGRIVETRVPSVLASGFKVKYKRLGSKQCLPVVAYFLTIFTKPQLFVTPWPIALQVPLSMGFSRQEYWHGLTCPSPGNLPYPGMKPASLCLLHWQVDSLPLEPPGNTSFTFYLSLIFTWTF